MSFLQFLLSFKDWPEVVQWVASDCAPAPDNLAAAYLFAKCHIGDEKETDILEKRATVIDAWNKICSELNGDRVNVAFEDRGLVDCLSGDWIHLSSQFLSTRVFTLAPESWTHMAAILNHLQPFQTDQPRIRASTTLLKKVELHYSASKSNTISTLELYERILHDTPRAKILEFLYAIETKTAEDDFYCMPADIVSSCIGRGRNPSDQMLELRVSDKDLEGIRRPMKGLPSFLALDKRGTIHFVFRGRVHSTLQSIGLHSVFATVPATNGCEQHVVECSSSGSCRLIAASAGGIEVTTTFRLDVEERLDWVDVRRDSHNSLVLEWGGNDSLRGIESWSCWAGLNEKMLDGEDTSTFVECDAPPPLSGPCDFSKHGNRLTVVRRHADRDDGTKRIWTRDQVVFEGSTIIEADDLNSCSAVWGAPSQYVAVHSNGVANVHSLQRGGERTKTTIAVPLDIVRLAVLPCFSR